jgi:Pyridoxamine 5'-phosphate oxidase
MADDKQYWIEEQALAQIDPSVVDKWGDPNKHPETQLTPAQQTALLEAGREMFITHLTKDGFPMVTVHVYVVLDGVLWSTSIKGRVKAAAYQRDPRCGICISSSGLSGLDFGGGMTIKARAEVIDDRAIVERVCREHGQRYYTSPKAQELFVGSLFTPNRVALRFQIDKIVSWKNIGMRQQ